MADWLYEEICLAAQLTESNGWKDLRPDDQRALALSQLLRSARLHPDSDKGDKFRNAAGVSRKTADIATSHPDYRKKRTRGNRLDRVIVEQFIADSAFMNAKADAIRLALQAGEEIDSTSALEVDEAHEGRLLFSLHARRERNPELRGKKIALLIAKHGTLACEICAFDFTGFYGARGAGYIEVHHVLPLYVSGEVKTRLEDLAPVCSNCHRMLHRSPWMKPDELASIVRETAGLPRTRRAIRSDIAEP